MDLQPMQNKIYEIRGYRIMPDFDLAELYEVEASVLNQSANRKPERFHPDFMFQLTEREWDNISSQFVITSKAKRSPFAFACSQFIRTV